MTRSVPITISVETRTDGTPSTSVARRLQRGCVDVLGDDGHDIGVDGEEPTVDHDRVAAALERLDGHLTLDEDAEQRRVTGQHAQLARDGAGTNELGLALPDLPVGGHHLNLE